MDNEYGGSCQSYQAATGNEYLCCSSCHEDRDMGYDDLPTAEHEGKWYDVCCGATR